MLKHICVIFLASTFLVYSQSYKNTYSTEVIINTNVLNSNFTESLISPNSLTTSLTFILPEDYPSGSFVITSLGNGSLSFSNPTITGSAVGNNNEIQFNESNSFASDADLVWINTLNRLGIGTSSPSYTVDVYGELKIENGELILYSEQGGTDYQLIFTAPANLASSLTYSWPNQDGNTDDVMVTDGSGVLSWSDDGILINFCAGEGESNETGSPGNSADGQFSFVGGGTNNSADGDNSFIGSGEDNNNGGDFSVIGAGNSNTITDRSNYSMIGAGANNFLDGDYSVIGAGFSNEIYNFSTYAFIGAGQDNTLYSDYAFIAGGRDNVIDSSSNRSFIGAGRGNYIGYSYDAGILAGQNNSITSGTYSTIGAGLNNQIVGDFSFIGAGQNNAVSGSFSSIVAGESNTILGDYSTILGGESNTITGNYALVIGNESRANGDYSLAMGRGAFVDHDGSFVLSDGTASTVASSSINQMTVMITNGIEFYTNDDLSDFVDMEAGENVWSGSSDSTKKENFVYQNPIEILDRINQLNIYSWSYKNHTLRNYGPMAQDFNKLFGKDPYGFIGNDTTISDHHLSSIGILGIQGLKLRNEKIKDEIDLAKKQNQKKKDKIEKIKKMIKAIENKREGSQ